jgi:dienelactone hydrolase
MLPMAPIDLAEMARMRVVYQLPGIDRVEVRRDLVYREIEGTPMTMGLYLPPPPEPPEPPEPPGLAKLPAGPAPSAGPPSAGPPPAGPAPPVGPAPSASAPAARRAAVLLIHGGPVPEALYGKVKNLGVFVSWGELLAASGLVAVAFNHLHHGWHDLDESAANVAAVIARLRADADALSLDPDRLCLWAFSGGGPQLAPALAAPDPGVRCLVSYYSLLDLRPLAARLPQIPAATIERFSPAACLAAAPTPETPETPGTPPGTAAPARPPRPPLLVARAGQDQPFINEALDGFLQAALAAGVELELWNHAAGQHGFDVLDDVDRTRQIAARTIEFIQTHCHASAPAAAAAGARGEGESR